MYSAVSSFITLCLGSIGMNCVIIIIIILQRNSRKMTISWSFSYNTFVKFYGKNILEPPHDRVINICVIKGPHCRVIIL